ncbi:hypothetical protein DYB36_000635 [Aphanomyces astaci]|uniref:Lon N-terminal domain-containing protein n=1 Tax=Aphanomyces astaci TaxID=112090 RepID=A0A397BGV4_APHAT|nr:hypothetical protein DYB36_000635 [Aphanomyces astaci]
MGLNSLERSWMRVVSSDDDDDVDMLWTEAGSTASSQVESSDEEDDEGEYPVNVDPFIVDHSYLGDDLTVATTSTSAHFTPGSLVAMPLVWLPNVIFPGETLPLRMLATSTLQLMTTRLRNGDDTFALINANIPVSSCRLFLLRWMIHELLTLQRHVGTVIQIERMYEYGDQHLSIVGRGRQRFELVDRVSLHHTMGQFMEGVSAQVRILPDFHAMPCPMPINFRRGGPSSSL